MSRTRDVFAPSFEQLGEILTLRIDRFLAGEDFESLAHALEMHNSWHFVDTTLKERFQSDGIRLALPLALAMCAEYRWPLPDWAANAFLESHRSIIEMETRSWDEVFGTFHKKGRKLEAERRERVLAPKIFVAVKEASRKHPIDEALFESVGVGFNVSGSTARDLYYGQKRHVETTMRAVARLGGLGQQVPDRT